MESYGGPTGPGGLSQTFRSLFDSSSIECPLHARIRKQLWRDFLRQGESGVLMLHRRHGDTVAPRGGERIADASPSDRGRASRGFIKIGCCRKGRLNTYLRPSVVLQGGRDVSSHQLCADPHSSLRACLEPYQRARSVKEVFTERKGPASRRLEPRLKASARSSPWEEAVVW